MNHLVEALEARRFFDAGHLDTTFGSLGHTTLTGETVAVDLDITPQNQILVTTHGNAELHLTQLTRDGAIDHSFGPSGTGVLAVPITQSVNESGNAVDPSLQTSVASDGSIFVLVGNLLYKYRPNGLRDKTFGKNGRAILGAFTPLDAQQVTIDNQARPYVLGADAKNNLQIVRLATNGKPDLSFAVQSVLTPGGGINLDAPNIGAQFAARTLADGSMLFSAIATGTAARGEFTEPAFDLAEVKLTKNGALARSFATHGLAIHQYFNTDIDSFSPGKPFITPDGTLFIAITDESESLTFDYSLDAYGPNGSPPPPSQEYDSGMSAEDLIFDGSFMAAIEFYDRAIPGVGLDNTQVIFHDAFGAPITSADDALNSQLSSSFPLRLAQQNDGSILVLSEPNDDPELDKDLRIDRFSRDDAPAPQLTAKTLTKPGNAPYRFTVKYRDGDGVSLASLGNDDITVIDPAGGTHRARLLATDSTTDGNTITATYVLSAPPDGWSPVSDGIYQVRINSHAVRDILGNVIVPRIIGQFAVQIPAG